MQSGPIHSLYSLYISAYLPLPPAEKRQWLLKAFPFWLSDGQFNTEIFVSWHKSVHFIDQEIWFRELKFDEQKEVLKMWALEPQLNFTPQLSSFSNSIQTSATSNDTPKFLPEISAIQTRFK